MRDSVNARRLAGLLMLLPMIWVLMPVFMFITGVQAGVGIAGFNDGLVVQPSDLVWVWPASVIAVCAGILTYLGRGRKIVACALGVWVAISGYLFFDAHLVSPIAWTAVVGLLQIAGWDTFRGGRETTEPRASR